MYAGRIRCRNQRRGLLIEQCKHLTRSYFQDYACYQLLNQQCLNRPYALLTYLDGSLIRKNLSNLSRTQVIAPAFTYPRLYGRSSPGLSKHHFRSFSSKGDGRNASEDSYRPVNDGTNFDKGKTWREKVGKDVKSCDAHANIGEEDQKEWLNNVKLSIESKKKESPFFTRHEKFKNEFLRRVVPWEKIHVSWETFPYYIKEHDKNILVRCVASHLKNKKINDSYGARLNGRILLQSVPGTELYRERLVRALAQELQVPLLVLDSSVLAPYDFGEDCASESELDDDNVESALESTSESEIEDENDASNEEEWTSSNEIRSDCSDVDEVQAAAEEALKKLVPYTLEEFEKRVSGGSESSSESSKSKVDESGDKSKQLLKKGDRVKYIGPDVHIEAGKRIILGKIPTSDGPTNVYTSIPCRPVTSGQRGEVYEVDGDRVAVILDIGCDNKAKEEQKDCDNKAKEEVKDEKSSEHSTSPPIYWMDVKDIEHDHDTQAEDCYIAMEALCEVLNSEQPLIVYFQDSSQWFSSTASGSNHKEFVRRVHEMFDKLTGPVVFICGRNKVETGSKGKEKLTMILPNFGRLAKLPLPLKRLTEGLKANKRSDDIEIYKLFSNVLYIDPPKEEDLVRIFNKQLDEDRKIVISRSNLNELHKVLEENELSCMDLWHVNTDSVILTKRKAEKVVGWAKADYLSSSINPSIKGGRLCLPRESLDIAVLTLKAKEASQKAAQNLKNLAKDEYESNFISAVVAPGEIGVKFDDIGALEDVKKTLNELVILPMRRPELFSHGNLLRPCKGILLFGPPGTGKTLLAKALATEAGANFISITGSTLTSKWFGDAEKLTKALFSFASKLAPVIVFVDEVDSLLGARGGGFEHEATRRMRNEFMAAWDGLRSKDSQRILILGATNRPFDLDDAVIRRLPRRIYVNLPDAGNRMKILKIFLSQENLVPNFSFEELANSTEGYSGSDLKNLCIAAAYRPVQELLEEETKSGRNDTAPILRPLSLDDFLQSKSKVGPSVAYDATSMNELRKWNEQYGEGGSRRKSLFGFGNKFDDLMIKF